MATTLKVDRLVRASILGSDPPSRGRRRLWTAAVVVLVALGVIAFSNMDAAAAGPYGMISVVPVLAWITTIALTLSFVVVLRRAAQDPLLPVLHVLGLIVLMYGASPLGEKVARWSVAWYTAGFINQVASTGHVLLHADARWSWPGLFGGVASLMAAAGVKDASHLLLWAPVVISIGYVAPLLSIARSLTNDPRVAWLAVWVFFIADWTGQAYLSDQAVIFLLFLASVALALHFFGHSPVPGPKRRGGRWPLRVLHRLQLAAASEAVGDPGGARTSTSKQRVAALAILVLIAAAATVSHQLTPVALVLDLLTLVVLGRMSARSLPFLIAGMVGLYISFFAVDFWSGHLAQLFGINGGGGSSFSQNVGSRIAGAQAHKIVVYLRLLFTASVWGLAAVGVLRRLRVRRLDVTAIACFVPPLVLPIVQPYGGEGLIRAFLYGLPFAGLLAAHALMPGRDSGRLKWIGLAAILVLAVPTFVVAAYGNEQFEEMRPGEVHAVQWFYAHAPPRSVMVSTVPNLPGPFLNLASEPFVSPPVASGSALVHLVRSYPGRPVYVLFSAGQEAYGQIQEGLPAGWEQAAERTVTASGHFVVVFQRPDAVLYAYRSR
ncbi:hypothetical protein K6U06_17575 [Acidiferrimicrobium sp. IK]|uniref:hypothetical protein n=1 Tax=Acidiferrimicrobium sp. IK TaxID=2871700 RepID=UPI0021CB4027|nr:hypothetical protein [Acidiferrimicrobium sp. IK]MCU4186180.1 hypothetical protein [Acidiferrimicrobium sp. IK]